MLRISQRFSKWRWFGHFSKEREIDWNMKLMHIIYSRGPQKMIRQAASDPWDLEFGTSYLGNTNLHVRLLSSLNLLSKVRNNMKGTVFKFFIKAPGPPTLSQAPNVLQPNFGVIITSSLNDSCTFLEHHKRCFKWLKIWKHVLMSNQLLRSLRLRRFQSSKRRHLNVAPLQLSCNHRISRRVTFRVSPYFTQNRTHGKEVDKS